MLWASGYGGFVLALAQRHGVKVPQADFERLMRYLSEQLRAVGSESAELSDLPLALYALAVAGRAGIPVAHYSPNEVKLAIAGDGAAGKAEVQRMVSRLLGLAQPLHPPDAADAAALALCHWWQAPRRAAEAGDGARPTRLAAAIASAIAREDSHAVQEAAR